MAFCQRGSPGIAQAALENDLLLIHNDRDFETIAQVRSLQNLRFRP
jgi:predicted nucleic acid-binding protein